MGRRQPLAEIAEDVKRVGASALAMVQGLSDSDVIPENGIWFITRGAQVLERELSGELAGATLWGLGKVVTLEAAHLQPRMIDLDPITPDAPSELVNDLMYPDDENHIAYRLGRRRAARLVRPGTASERLTLPDDSDWVLAPHRDGVFDRPEIKRLPTRTLEPKEVLVSVEATGLNFWDVFRSLGFIEEGDLGRELCGHVPRHRLRSNERVHRRPCSWAWIRGVRAGDGYACGTGRSRAGRHIRIRACHNSQRVRVRCALIPLLRS